MLAEKFYSRSFVVVLFSLGWISLYGNLLSFIILGLLLLNIKADPTCFRKNLWEARYYIGVPVAFLIYFSLHTLVFHFIVTDGIKASYGMFESLLLYFILIPLYILSLKKWITPALLRCGLFFFCLGIAFFNICILFSLIGFSLFPSPAEALNFIYDSRFGANKGELFGGDLMLEPQAMSIALAGVTAFYLAVISRRIMCWIMFLLLLLFLSFTVTKAAILACMVGLMIIGGVELMKVSGVRRMIVLGIALGGMAGIWLILPGSYQERFVFAYKDTMGIMKGNEAIAEGSFAPRMAMWEDAMLHTDEFALWGKGVYFKETLKKWYEESPYTAVGQYPNTHNSFLEFWIMGGVFGLLLIVSFFVFPLFRMWRQHRWSALVLAGLAVIFFASNTCVLFVHTNSLGIILVFLSIYYFYSGELIRKSVES